MKQKQKKQKNKTSNIEAILGIFGFILLIYSAFELNWKLGVSICTLLFVGFYNSIRNK